MKMFSLRTLIDDILLIVRNNNISESEDLSRDQIAAWIMHYVAYLKKKEKDKNEETGDDEPDDSTTTTIGPLKIIDSPIVNDDNQDDDKSCCDHCCMHRMRTKEKISTLNDGAEDIISVHDASGCVIQYMHQMRRHYHYFRRYTYLEPTCWFDDGYIYIDGPGVGELEYIYVTIMQDPTDNAEDEDSVKIPGWMIPDIKKAIMTNELAFMLNRPSDDSNNSTLASVKPHDPQDKEE